MAEAKKILADAGFDKSNPLKVELLYNTNDNHKKIAIAVAGMWKQFLGVETSLRNEEWKVYLESRNKKQFEVMRAAWIGDYVDPYSFLELLRGDIGEQNPAGYANPALRSGGGQGRQREGPSGAVQAAGGGGKDPAGRHADHPDLLLHPAAHGVGQRQGLAGQPDGLAPDAVSAGREVITLLKVHPSC